MDDLVRALLKAKHAVHISALNTDEETSNKTVLNGSRKLLLSSHEEETDEQYPWPPNILVSKQLSILQREGE